MQHATCNGQLTTVVTMTRGRQHATHDKQTDTNGNRGRLRRRHTTNAQVNENRAAGAAAGKSRRRRASLAATAHLSTACRDGHADCGHLTCVHVGRVARGARTRCTHLHPRLTRSMPGSPDALFASASLVASRMVRTSEGGQCRPEHSYSARTGRAATSFSRIQPRANPGDGMLQKRSSRQNAQRHTS